MLQKTVGIVLHTLKYNDISNIVVLIRARMAVLLFLCLFPKFTEIGGEDGIVPAAFHDRV